MVVALAPPPEMQSRTLFACVRGCLYCFFFFSPTLDLLEEHEEEQCEEEDKLRGRHRPLGPGAGPRPDVLP